VVAVGRADRGHQAAASEEAAAVAAAAAAAVGRHGLQAAAAAAVPRAARRVVLATGPVEAALALQGAAVARAEPAVHKYVAFNRI